MTNEMILSIRDITKSFGGIKALTDVSLEVQRGSIHGLIGPNGAGKTTLFNIISGFLTPDSGDIYYEGGAITGMPPYMIARRGLIRTFQEMKQLSSLRVIDNVRSGCYRTNGRSLRERFFPRQDQAQQEAEIDRRLAQLLTSSGLADKAHLPSGVLPFGELRFLDVARALAAKPRLLLLDEPGAGLNLEEVHRLEELLIAMKGEDLAIVLIEHDVEMVFRLCDRVSVLDYGGLIAEGVPDDIRVNPAVLAAYLGEAVEEQEV
jgi:branched-chain amino acid transport system ATP-binding protein